MPQEQTKKLRNFLEQEQGDKARAQGEVELSKSRGREEVDH